MAGCLVMALASAIAHGHNGPAMTTDVRFVTSSPDTVLIGSNLGLLITHDGGCTVEWICERNVGFSSPFQPKYALAADGAILVTTYQGLRISRDNGCNFTTHGPAVWSDALDVGPTGEVWIATSATPGTNSVFASVDHGETFTARGLESTTVAYRSLRIAPGDPERVYVTGNTGTSAHLYRLDDGELPAAGIAYGISPQLEIVAVDPSDPDTLFVVSRDVTAPRDDRLYRSIDAGSTFVEVLATSGAKIHDMVIGGATINVTSRVLHESGNFEVGGPVFGSIDAGKTFVPLAGAPALMCLGLSPAGTPIGCGANWEPDFKALAAFEGGGWTKRWRFTELAAAVTCAEGDGNRACDAEWTQLEIDLGRTGPTCGPLASDVPPIAARPGCGCTTSDGVPGLALALLVACCLGRRTAVRHRSFLLRRALGFAPELAKRATPELARFGRKIMRRPRAREAIGEYQRAFRRRERTELDADRLDEGDRRPGLVARVGDREALLDRRVVVALPAKESRAPPALVQRGRDRRIWSGIGRARIDRHAR